MIKTFLVVLGALVVATFAGTMANAKGGSHSVRGHVTKNGTYVQPHRATNRNETRRDNYSHKGNVNPYMGKQGTKE